MSARPFAARRRARGLVSAALAALLVLAGCTPNGGSTDEGAPPQDQLTAFIGDWTRLDLDKAAALTSSPGQAGQVLTSVTANLKPIDLQIAPGSWTRTAPDAATIPVTFSWQLPAAGLWTYDTTWSWHRKGSGNSARWTLDWTPTVIHPQLGAQQSLALRTSDTTGGSLVDRDNQPVLAPVTVYSVQLAPTEVADLAATATTLSKLLKKFDATLTAAAIEAGAKKADPKIGYTVINLREDDYRTVKTALAAIPAVTTPSDVRSLPATRDFAHAVIGEVTPIAEQLSQGKAGWRIVAIDSAGEEITTLSEKAAQPGAKVMLTLDTPMQKAAEAALATIKEPATLVAIQPSTGEILTIAQNTAANAQGPIALMGQYPPGSTFKIVTATAAIDRKLITPTTQVPCPSQIDVDNRTIHNDFNFDLGTVSATLAFAKSCNTTFAHLATQMPADALTTAAKQYGIGIDFVIPGITTLTGQVPAADSTVQAAENGFGQGVVLVTPLSAALMAATAATGNMPMPTLIRDSQVTADQPAPPRSDAARTGIRTLMRAVVTDGTATLLGDVGTVFAKTGTAEYTDAKGDIHAHAWTVGFRGDVAFSVLIVGGDSSKRTNVVAHDFLSAVPST